MGGKIKIVKASEEDVTLILSFIMKIAEYEKLSDEVSATEEILKKNLFGKKRYAEVLIAYFDEKPAGYAVYFYNFSTFLGKPGIYLEDLFVLPEMRGKGIGKTLFMHLNSYAQKNGYGRFEWSVLNWNKPAIDFYKSFGAKQMSEWSLFRIDEQTMGIKVK